MKKVEDIKILNIDDVPYAVDAMSDAVKEMVDLFNDWNKKEVEARSHLLMVMSAKTDMSNKIVQQVRKEQAEAKAAAEAKAVAADDTVVS